MFSFKRASGKVVLVADVDDMSVGVSVVELAAHAPAAVLSCERQTLPLEDRSLEQSVVAVTKLLEDCTDQALKAYMASDAKKAPKPLRAVYVILRAPWTRFRTSFAEETYEKPRPVTKEVIASLAKKALEIPSEIDRGAILETGIMEVYVNGYPTGTPIGKRATRAGVVAYESDVHDGMKKGVVAVLSKVLPGRTPVVRSSMCALLSVLNEHVPNIHRFVILDVGSSSTNCAVVLKESVSQSALVHEGLGTILKRISGAGLPEEMLTQLRMLASDSCSTDACKALKDTLARTEPDLTKVFGEAFAMIASKRRLPNAAILSAPAELSPWLQGFFSRIDFSQFTATMQPLTVEPLTAEHLQDAVAWQTGVRTDTGIGIAAGYVNILEQAH